MTYIHPVVFPACKIKWLSFLVPMLEIQVLSQMLYAQLLMTQIIPRMSESHLVNVAAMGAHTIIKFYPFSPEVDSSSGPVSVVVVDGNKDHIL